jgi:hypothetical protein
MRMLIFICLFAAMTLTPSAVETREYTLGDLAITYDPAHWKFEQLQEGDPLVSRPDTFNATCLDCRGDAFVAISVADMTVESEAVTDPMWARDRTHSTMTVGELTFGITTIHSPCRNYVPASATAGVAHKGRSYIFRSGVVVGCHGSSGVGSQRFEELLRGLHPRD